MNTARLLYLKVPDTMYYMILRSCFTKGLKPNSSLSFFVYFGKYASLLKPIIYKTYMFPLAVSESTTKLQPTICSISIFTIYLVSYSKSSLFYPVPLDFYIFIFDHMFILYPYSFYIFFECGPPP